MVELVLKAKRFLSPYVKKCTPPYRGPIAGGYRAYSRGWNQSQGSREHLLGVLSKRCLFGRPFRPSPNHKWPMSRLFRASGIHVPTRASLQLQGRCH
eukprot:6238249-Pyramimonas_sp.AAC.1